MALAVVGGAFLSSFLNVLFDRMASPAFIRFFKNEKMNMAQLRKLKTSLNTVNAVLDDAEHKQIASSAVKNWLDELRDAAYEAVDLLDLIEYQAACTTKVEGAGHQTIADHMSEIIERLEYLKQQIGDLGLRDGGKKEASSNREPTTSVVQESDILGRSADKEAIFKLLQQNDSDISVIPLVGMGGIGKTTLAQLIYNDGRAIELFERRAWVCVSENYDGFKIKREILKQVKDSKGDNGLTPTQIDEEHKKSLKGKKYLIVLDDMWNDSYADWDKLVTPLKLGALGSKIIVTTRGENVASIMRTVPSSYQLRGLDPNDCWLLFVKHAFTAGTVIDQKLEAIGRKIVKKCKSLPLAAKMLGGLLRSERDVSKWEEVLNSNIWDLPSDSILPSLRLSYQHLPPYLKPCFAYCAIFPKDSEMDKEEIIHLWMAQGFLAQPVRGKKMEELGEECLDELLSRSFIQESRHPRGTVLFLMHDLINDLARQIFGEFLARIEANNCCEIHAKTHHVSCTASGINVTKIHEGISHVHVMNSLILESLFYGANKEIVDHLVHNQIPRFWSLRALSLNGFHGLMTLPNSIDNLKLLRYLNVARTSLKRLPESLCSQFNLQTLILYGCKELVELPKNIGGLTNLHCLDIRETPMLHEMPVGIGNLKDLRILDKFVVGNENGLHINELGKFEHLRGALSILKLQNVVQLSKHLLQNKKYLEDLKLEWSSIAEDSVHARTILERLQPHTSIKKISIFGYGGTKFADWIGNSSYTNMVFLKLEGCKYCTSLPPLGQLSFLEHLTIVEFDAVVEVGAEFYGSCRASMKSPFRSLKTLRMEKWKQWQIWSICGENGSDKCEPFAKLEKMEIWDCPNLRSISSTHKIFKSLRELQVGSCNSLRTSNLLAVSDFKKLELICDGRHVLLEHVPSGMYKLCIDKFRKWLWDHIECKPTMERIEEIRIHFDALEDIAIEDSDVCECIPLEQLPMLRRLRVDACHNLKSLSASDEPLHHPLTSLLSLEIRSCDSLASFTRGGIPAPNLTHLTLNRCSNLRSLPDSMHVLLPSLQRLELAGCGLIESFPEGGLPAKLQSLQIYDCNELIGGRLQWGLQRLDALSHLRLGNYYRDDLDFFPEPTLLPSSLNSLEMYLLVNLKYLNSEGLQHLDCLNSLRIGSCRNLRCLPEGLPSSLTELVAELCPLLEGRCEPDTGEDWHKVSHISKVSINEEETEDSCSMM